MSGSGVTAAAREEGLASPCGVERVVEERGFVILTSSCVVVVVVVVLLRGRLPKSGR